MNSNSIEGCDSSVAVVLDGLNITSEILAEDAEYFNLSLGDVSNDSIHQRVTSALKVGSVQELVNPAPILSLKCDHTAESPLHSLLGLFYTSMTTDMRSAGNISPSPASRSLSRSSNISVLSTGQQPVIHEPLVRPHRASTPVLTKPGELQFDIGSDLDGLCSFSIGDDEGNMQTLQFITNVPSKESSISEPEVAAAFRGQQTMDILAATGHLNERREEKGGYGTPSSYASEQEMNLYFNNSERSTPNVCREEATPSEILSAEFISARSNPSEFETVAVASFEPEKRLAEPGSVLKKASDKVELTIKRLEDFTNNMCQDNNVTSLLCGVQKSGSHSDVHGQLNKNLSNTRRNSDGLLVKRRKQKSEDRLMKMLQMASDSVIDNDISSALILNITTPNKRDKDENERSEQLQVFDEFQQCLQEFNSVEKKRRLPEERDTVVEQRTSPVECTVQQNYAEVTADNKDTEKYAESGQLLISDDRYLAEAKQLVESLLSSFNDENNECSPIEESAKSCVSITEPIVEKETDQEQSCPKLVVEDTIKAVDATKQDVEYSYTNDSLSYLDEDSLRELASRDEIPDLPTYKITEYGGQDKRVNENSNVLGNTDCGKEKKADSPQFCQITEIYVEKNVPSNSCDIPSSVVAETVTKPLEQFPSVMFDSDFDDTVGDADLLPRIYHQSVYDANKGKETPTSQYVHNKHPLLEMENCGETSPGKRCVSLAEQNAVVIPNCETEAEPSCQVLIESEQYLENTEHDLKLLLHPVSQESRKTRQSLQYNERNNDNYADVVDFTGDISPEKDLAFVVDCGLKEANIPSIVITSPKPDKTSSYDFNMAPTDSKHEHKSDAISHKDKYGHSKVKHLNDTFSHTLVDSKCVASPTPVKKKTTKKYEDKYSGVSAYNFCDEFWEKYNILESKIDTILKPTPPKYNPTKTSVKTFDTVTVQESADTKENFDKVKRKVSFNTNSQFSKDTTTPFNILSTIPSTTNVWTPPNVLRPAETTQHCKTNPIHTTDVLNWPLHDDDDDVMTLSRNFLSSIEDQDTPTEVTKLPLSDQVTALTVSSSLSFIKRNLRNDIEEVHHMHDQAKRNVEKLNEIERDSKTELDILPESRSKSTSGKPSADLLRYLEDLYVEKEQLQKKIEVCNRDREDAEKAARKATQDLKLEREKEETRFDNMKHKSANKKDIRKRVDEFESASKTTTGDLERAEFDLKSLECDRFSGRVDNDHSLVDLKADNSNMREKLDRMHEISAENLLLQSDVADYQAELTELRTEAKELRNKCYELSEENRQHKAEVRDLRRYIDLLKANKTGDTRQDLLSKIEYYQMEHDRLLEEVRRLKHRLGDVSPRSPRNRSASPRPSSRHSFVSSVSPSKQNVRFSTSRDRARSPVTDAMAASTASSLAASRLTKDRSISPSAALNIRDLTMERYNQHMDGPDSPRSIDSDCTEVLLKPMGSQVNGSTAPLSGVRSVNSDDDDDVELSVHIKKRNGRATDSSGSYRGSRTENCSPKRRSCSPACSAGFRSVSPKLSSSQKEVKDSARDRYPTMVKRSLPRRAFAPRSPGDLMLGYCIKFTRPGGKLSRGTVRYIGHLPTRDEIFVGVELDGYDGKHSGTFQGTKYFTCSPNKGIFTPFSKVIMAWE
uniref:uncharacterized protein LOC100175371 isoform X2 n=1 Tax=Ciona intestinalis TaxID=7719 RepID=UPI000EF4B6C7|nr:uncharacterized protein LOC100175371 isoform X2 [Ciona intestinalis]|eukprot:XP_026692823.1 uncharacterized protein LOC100175371 isoform X2 [Ciona intestinalis]